ncbi:MAG: helix-turn-helix domain-containing protein, partial [Gammaproteobacteria bacterium]|nr:helix-turn-helix domain-containing protein [Gammaproteobacteria bacterium]
MSETPEIEPSSAAPGQILKRAREARNLTVAAIATLMNLDLRTIEALERGDLSKLPAPIFVRGYLRGYARLVGVAEAAVLEAYQAQAPQEPVPRGVGMSKVPVRPAFRAPALPWRGLLWVVIVLVAVGLGVQWGPELIARFSGNAPQETTVATEPGVDAPTSTLGADTADVVPLGAESSGTTAPGAELAESPSALPGSAARQALPLETPAPEESPASSTPSVASGSVDLSLPEQRPAPMTEAAPSATESAPTAPVDTDTAASVTTESEATVATANQSAPPAP